jgi:hypothetical protein
MNWQDVLFTVALVLVSLAAAVYLLQQIAGRFR